MGLSDNLPLFIFEMANNHMGSVEHGVRLIEALHEASRAFPYRCAVKLQYRSLETFIHPAFRQRNDYKFIKRFRETELSWDAYNVLVDAIVAHGFLTVCTPFDEHAVDIIEAHGINIIKVASCSMTDWPLLERIVKTDKPIIASTAGEPLDHIDKLASFLGNRDRDYALMHCVAEYPTPDDHLQLNQIDLFRGRYSVPIGYSTHESPGRVDTIAMAIAKGTVIFEKHVGLEAPGITLNAYSATPAQITQWLEAASRAFTLCGATGTRYMPSVPELASLRELRRGVFARRDIAPGEHISFDDVFFAIPTVEGQVTANDCSKYLTIVADKHIPADAPVTFADIHVTNERERVYAIVLAVKEFLEQSHLPMPKKVDMEISHHYGIERFREFGLVMLSVVNREYCKKMLVMLPGQGHPEQYHRAKEETFVVLYGQAVIELNGIGQTYQAGDVITVEKGVRHAFRTDSGVVMEEISTTHYTDDSYYTDEAINANTDRKTFVSHWIDAPVPTEGVQ